MWKIKEGGKCWPFKFPGSHFSWRGRGGGTSNEGVVEVQQQWMLLCLYLCDQKQQTAVRAQIPTIWRIGSFLPFLDPRCYVLTLGHVHSCLPSGWWVVATVLRAKIDQNCLQLTIQVFLWKLQAFNRLQSSKIFTSDRFCQWDFCVVRRPTPGSSYCHLHLVTVLNPDFSQPSKLERLLHV